MKHSNLAPSGAGVWGRPGGCRASVRMQAPFPDDETSQDALDGEAAHALGELFIGFEQTNTPYTPDQFIGLQAANKVVYTTEMTEAAAMYAEHVGQRWREHRHSTAPQLCVEERVNIHRVHAECYGTPDCSLYAIDARKLYIWDFKFGHLYVDEFENWQLICYAAGLLEKYNIGGTFDQEIMVHLIVVQPRAYNKKGPIREWVVNAAELRAHINILAQSALEVLASDSKTQTGKHCRYCRARHACPAALEAGLALFEASQDVDFNALDPQALGLQLDIIRRAIDQLTYLELGFAERVDYLVRNGQRVPGYAVAQTYGLQMWEKSNADILRVTDALQIDLRVDKIKTPKQAKAAGIEPAIVDALSTTPRTGVKVVAENLQELKRVFSS